MIYEQIFSWFKKEEYPLLPFCSMMNTTGTKKDDAHNTKDLIQQQGRSSIVEIISTSMKEIE